MRYSVSSTTSTFTTRKPHGQRRDHSQTNSSPRRSERSNDRATARYEYYHTRLATQSLRPRKSNFNHDQRTVAVGVFDSVHFAAGYCPRRVRASKTPSLSKRRRSSSSALNTCSGASPRIGLFIFHSFTSGFVGSHSYVIVTGGRSGAPKSITFLREGRMRPARPGSGSGSVARRLAGRSASSGQIDCQSLGRKSFRVTSPLVARSISTHRSGDVGETPLAI